MWEDDFYIFDSETISEKEFDEKVEYEDYQAFADSMLGEEVVKLLNELHEENDVLKQELKTKAIVNKQYEELQRVKKENEELKSKVKRYMEIELLKAKDFANCHNCRNNRSVHDGVALDGMCAINGLINVDGYFDTEYHKLPTGTICPCWELEE
jgi:hypothetical protein